MSTAISTTIRENSRLPLITYGNRRRHQSPATWTLSQIRLRPQSTINSFQTASIDFEWQASDSFALKFGPQWKNYIFKSTELRRSNGTTGNQEGVFPGGAATAPITSYSRARFHEQRARHACRHGHDLAHPGPDCRGRRARPEQLHRSTRWASSLRSATTTRSRKTTSAPTCRAISTSSSAGARCAATSACATWRPNMTSHGIHVRPAAPTRRPTVAREYTTCCRR